MKERGLVIEQELGSDRILSETPMAQCVHCGGQFPIPSLRKCVGTIYDAATALNLEQQGKASRGWCMNCNGPVCGPGCAECVPVERYLAILEGTASPTSITVGGNLWLP